MKNGISSPAMWILPALALFSSGLRAQTKIVALPGNLAAREGGTFLDVPFTRGPSRTQILVAPALLSGLGTKAVITAVGFRPDGNGSFAAKSVSLEVVLSTAAGTTASPNPLYGGNRGNDAVTVLPRTNVSLPWAFKPSPPPSGVKVWVRFTRSFTWKGGGLCLEAADFTTTKKAWPVDAARAVPYGFGRAFYEGDPCPVGKNTIVSSPVPWPGAPVEWKTRLLDGSASGGGVLLLLGTGAKKWGGLTLPFSLDPLFGTRGCKLYTDVVSAFSATLTAGKAQVDMGTLPASPVLSGAQVTAQWIVPGGGVPGGLGLSNLARLRIGQAPPFVTLYNYLNDTNPNSKKAEFLAAAVPVLFLEVR